MLSKQLQFVDDWVNGAPLMGKKDITAPLWVHEEGTRSLGADKEWNKAGLIKMDCW